LGARIQISKRRGIRLLAGSLLLGALSVLAVGCGGPSSTFGSSSSGPAVKGEPSAQFSGTSAANQFAKFGEEASPAEIGIVAAIVERSLEARAAKNWAGQCATLSKAAVEIVEGGSSPPGRKGCAKELKAQGEDAPKSILENNIERSVVTFREAGNKGYALYHGTDKKDWAMPMEREGTEWKVGALVAQEVDDKPKPG
jgi:hypothetical protein